MKEEIYNPYNNSLHADCHKCHGFCEKKKPQKPRHLWHPVKLALCKSQRRKSICYHYLSFNNLYWNLIIMIFLKNITICIFSVLLFSSPLSANSDFSTDESVLFVPKVDINGKPSLKNVRLKLDFSNNTFQILGSSEYPNTLSDSVIKSDTNIVEQVTTGLRGCVKSSNNVICYFFCDI